MTSRDLRLGVPTNGIAEIVLSRQYKKNAISTEMWSSFPPLLRDIEHDEGIRAVIIRGEGADFSAGADISEFGSVRSTPEAAGTYERVVAAAESAIVNCTRPTVAAIEGVCIGGGLEIALACDLRVAAAGAQFGLTPARIGLVYSYQATRRLVLTVGPSFAKRLLFTAELVDAAEAVAHGLADILCPDSEATDVALRLASVMAENSLASIRGSKEIIHMILDGDPLGSERALRLSLEAIDGPDFAEGVTAFLERRKPNFRDQNERGRG